MMQTSEQNKTAGGGEEPQLLVRGRPVRPWIALIALIFGFFMALLDATITNIAIPAIETNLKADLTVVSWVLNAYNLVFAVLLVSVGRLADMFGRKRIFMLGMIVFSVASLLCALAQTVGEFTGQPAINWLIGFRAFQAIGAAALAPVSMAIIMAIFPPKQRGAAIGLWGALAGLASAAGPVLGGFLVENFDWRWIFFVNLPICIVGLILVALFVPETSALRGRQRLDLPGTLTLTGGIFCLVLAILQGNSWGWTSAPVLGLFGGLLVCLVLFIIAELLQRDPIVDFKLFKIASFSGANLTMLLFGTAIQGAFLITVLYFTNARGYNELEAAYALLPLPIASFFVSAIAGRLSNRINSHLMGILGLILLIAGFVLFSFIHADTAYIDIAWRGVLIGAGMGMLFQSQATIALSEIPRARLGVGSGIFNTFRQVGFALGVAILISVFTGTLTPNLDQARQRAVTIVQDDQKLPAEMRANIATQLKKADLSSSNNQQGGGGQKYDLTQAADHLPAQVPAQQKEAIRSELKSLGDRIGNEFTNGVVDSFKTAWLISAIFAAAGLVSALVAFLSSRKSKPGEPGEVPAEAMAVGH
jgi:EmrB/QacA subfamily drug resistance transporter